MELKESGLDPTLVISIDLELAWGFFDKAYGPELLARSQWTREEGVPALLGELERNQLTATWAIVGFVMLNGVSDGPPLTEVKYRHFDRPWLSYAASAAPNEIRCWFAPDIVDQIRRIAPKQEIGAHSLSHIVFGNPGTPRERVEEELRCCQEIARGLNVELKSFVFPRNSVAHLDALAKAGFLCYRSPDVLPVSLPIPRGPAVSALLCDILGIAPRPVTPILRNGLVDIPGSLMLRDMRGWRNFIPDRSRARRLQQGLRSVLQKGGVFHIWLHPESFYDERPRLQNILFDFFETAGALVRDGKLRCLTMGQLATEVREGRALTEHPADSTLAACSRVG